MQTLTINEIMSLLDVEEMAKRFGLLHMSIRENYKLPVLVVKDYDQFVTILTEYYEMHYFKRYRIEKDLKLPEHWAYRYVRSLMDSTFQSDGGYEFAFGIAKTGANGGLKMLIDKIYQHFLREDEETYINYIINLAMGLTWEGRVELMRQYLKMVGRNMPENITTKSPERLAEKCAEIIRNHVHYISTLRTNLSNY
jgi:hypothetical protein